MNLTGVLIRIICQGHNKRNLTFFLNSFLRQIFNLKKEDLKFEDRYCQDYRKVMLLD